MQIWLPSSEAKQETPVTAPKMLAKMMQLKPGYFSKVCSDLLSPENEIFHQNSTSSQEPSLSTQGAGAGLARHLAVRVIE